MPSYKQVIRAGRAIGVKPRDELQRIHLQFICENPFNLTKGTRQWGKTFDHAWHGYTGLTQSEPLGIGMPTQAQGSRIIANSVSKMMARLEKAPGVSIRREQDNALYKEWSGDCNATMGVLSMHETGDPEKQGKSTEGWTFRDIKFDEGHLCGLDIYNKVLPTTDSFGMFGIPINIGILGVGGYPLTLIETMLADAKAGYKCMRVIPDLHNKYVPKGKKFIVTDREIIYNLLEYYPYDENMEPCPRLGDVRREFYTGKHAAVPEAVWSQFYLCETQHGGSGRIFRNLSGGVALPANAIVAHEVGVDVGGGSDKTVMYIVETARNYISGKFYGGNVIERNEICTDDFVEQAKWTWEILDRYEQTLDLDRMLYEGNNVGKYYGKEVTKHPVYKNFRKFHTSDQGSTATNNKGIKTLLIEKLMSMNQDGLIGVPDESAYKALSTLTYELSDGGVYKWPHSDDLSAFWVWAAGMESARGI